MPPPPSRGFLAERSVRIGLEINEAKRVIQEVLDAVAVPAYSEKSK